ncbi:uncharacterized protein PG986_002743 [Apiospora aurea]|uniref:Uncharacterized protein n=1 Tax=Apiospora aurea TaxID=335848 RepID=A0ABR1QQ57_9PEZI
MVCYIAPAAHLLGLEKEKNERLEAEVKHLNEELVKAKLEIDSLRRQSRKTSKCSNKPSRSSSAAIAKQISTPSYLRPTAASNNRTKPAEPIVTTKPPPPTLCKGNSGRIYAFDDAKLVDVTHRTGLDPGDRWHWIHSSHRPTQSSYEKVRLKVHRANPRTRRSSTPESTEWEGSTVTSNDHQEATLPAHIPETKPGPINRFPGGKQEVRLERVMVDAYLDFETTNGDSLYDYPGVSSALTDCTFLRNECSHFGGQSLDADEYDKLLKAAHALAVAVRDKPRAIRARALRDELGKLATDTLNELETLSFSSILGIRREWKVHHESLFGQKFCYTSSDADDCLDWDGFKFSPAIMLALRAWRWQLEIETNENGTQGNAPYEQEQISVGESQSSYEGDSSTVEECG